MGDVYAEPKHFQENVLNVTKVSAEERQRYRFIEEAAVS